jgi:hypothetical protein
MVDNLILEKQKQAIEILNEKILICGSLLLEKQET